jgi:hypothetical protein
MIGANMEVSNPTGSNQFGRKPANLPISKISQPQAAKLLNVSDRSIRDAKTILGEAPEKDPMIARIRLFPFAYVWCMVYLCRPFKRFRFLIDRDSKKV